MTKMNTPINRYIDHAVLKPEMTNQEARDAIAEGVSYKVKTVCVRPCDIPMATALCEGSETEVCCVLAFPHGDTPTAAKEAEARLYVALGVREIDMVANYGLIRSHEWNAVLQDIVAVASITRQAGILLKVIIETSTLTIDEIAKATEICVEAGADYVKTSTGFNGEGATEAGIKAMLEAAAGRIAIKASGGVRDRARADMFVKMGCSRLGVGHNSTRAICDGTAPVSKENY